MCAQQTIYEEISWFWISDKKEWQEATQIWRYIQNKKASNKNFHLDELIYFPDKLINYIMTEK